MLIDWFTVAAQVVNFLILVWLLKRFLYRPILRAIDEREKRIAARLAEAEAKKTDAEKERADFEDKNKAFERQREALLRQTANDAQNERQRLFDDARKEADALREKLRESIRNEQDHLGREMTGRIRQEVFALARKTLGDLAGVDLEERIGEMFVHRLCNLNGSEKEQFGAALKKSSQPVRVRSAFTISPAQRNLVESAIRKAFPSELSIAFETEPDLVSGIELVTNGQKISWSITDYLSSLEKSTDALFDGKVRSP
jgi:F-type H+-transporting ATPase subunit b